MASNGTTNGHHSLVMPQCTKTLLSVEHSTGLGVPNGSGEIRTHGTLSRTHTFQACALNHSATDPACTATPRRVMHQAR